MTIAATAAVCVNVAALTVIVAFVTFVVDDDVKVNVLVVLVHAIQ